MSDKDDLISSLIGLGILIFVSASIVKFVKSWDKYKKGDEVNKDEVTLHMKHGFVGDEKNKNDERAEKCYLCERLATTRCSKGFHDCRKPICDIHRASDGYCYRCYNDLC